MKRILDNWPKIAFVCVPLCMATVQAAVLLSEHLQPDTQKAIRLVRESSSRKENFTVQQYLYSTVFYLKDRGEAIEIDGWQAAASDPGMPIIVEFSYTGASGRHVARWEANIKDGEVTPLNDSARDLSWH
jgi:hypothetical protein